MVPKDIRRHLDFSKELSELGWYHSFAFPDGTTVRGVQSIDLQNLRYRSFEFPDDLRGKRVLDVGSWDGWFAFETERRGASVTAIDCVPIPNFLDAHTRFRSSVCYRILDVYQLPASGIGTFDYVLFLGVLYHLKHPLLALEIVCGLTADTAIVESFVTDGGDWQEHQDQMPSMEFYETNELGGHLDNWFGPSVACLMALCRAAGFARVELLRTDKNGAAVACRRRWDSPPLVPDCAPPELRTVVHSRDYGINVSSTRDDYLTWWFRGGEQNLNSQAVFPEVEGMGVPVLHLAQGENREWQMNTRVPPGLTPGWKSVRLRTLGSVYSNSQRIAVDIVAASNGLTIVSLCDGKEWTPHVALLPANGDGFLSLWVRGLGENYDRNNVVVDLSSTRLRVEFIGAPDDDAVQQVNVRVPASTATGSYSITVAFGQSVSAPAPCVVKK